jgi:hypothetical protein
VQPDFVSCDEHRGESFVVFGFIQPFLAQTHADDSVRQWTTTAQTYADDSVRQWTTTAQTHADDSVRQWTTTAQTFLRPSNLQVPSHNCLKCPITEINPEQQFSKWHFVSLR